MHGGKSHRSSPRRADCPRPGRLRREESPRAHPAQGSSAATSVGNKECKVKQMSDTIQYSWVYGLNLKPPPPLRLQQTALCHKQFAFRVLPKPRWFLNREHKIHIANGDREGKQSPKVLCPPGQHKHAGALVYF